MIEFSLYQIKYGTNGLEKFNVVNPDVVDVSDLEETLELDEAAFRVGNASVTVHGLNSDHFASAGNMMEPFVFQITENGGSIFHGVVVPDSVSWNAETNRTAFEVASWEYLLTEAGSLPARSIYEGDAIRSITTPGGAYIVFPEFVEIRTGDVIVLDAAEGERREVVTAVYNKGEVLWVDGRNVTVPVDEKWAAIITSTTSPALSGSPSGQIINRSAGPLHQQWRIFTIRSMDLAMNIVERYGDSMRPQTTDNSKYADHIPFVPPRNAIFREFQEIQLKYYTNDTERESFTLRNAIVFVSPDGTDYVEQSGSIVNLPSYGEIWVNLGVGPTPQAYDWWEYDRMEFIDRNPIHITEDINGKVKILGRDLYGYSGEWVNEPIYPLDHFKVTDIISALFTLDDIDPTTGYNRLGILPRIFRSVIDPNTTGHTIRREVELDNDPLGALRELQLASETLIRFHPVLDNGMPRLDVEIIPRSSIGGSAESGSDIIEWVENPVISPPQAVIVSGNNDYLTRKDDIEISGFWFETSSGLTPDTVTDEERRQFGLPTGDRVIEIEVPELPSGTMNSDNIYYGDGEAVYNDPKYKALARRYYEFYKKFTRTVEGTVAHRDPSLLGKYITFNEGKISESVLITQITSSLNEGELRTTIIGRIGDYTSPSASAPVAVIIGSHLFIDRTGAGGGVSVSLSGARSYDTDPGGLTYDWHYRSVGSSTWTYSGSGISFNELLVEGRYQVRLTVSNQVTGLSNTTIRNIEVETEAPPVYTDPSEDGALTSLKHIEKFQSGVWGVVRWRPTWRELEQTSLGETRYRISVGGELPEIDWDAEPDHRVHYPVYPVLQGIDSKGIYRDFRVPLHHSHNSTLEIYVAVYGEDPIIMPFIFDRDTDADIHNFDLRLLANGNAYFSATPDEDTDYFEVWKSVDGGDFTQQGTYFNEVSNVQVHAGLPIGSVLTVQLRPYNPEGMPGNRQSRSVTNSFIGDHPDFTDVTLNGDIIFSGGGRISSAGQDALEILSEDGSNHGELTVRVLRVIDHIDAIQTDILEVEDSYIKVNRGQTGTPSLNGGLIAERGQTDAYLEWDEGRDKWGWRMGADIGTGTFRAFVDESRSISTSNGITGGGDLSANRQFELTGQALSLHLATGTGVFKRTSGGVIGVNLIVNADIATNTITNNRLVSPHITLNAGAGIAAIGQVDLGGSSTIRLTGQALALHELSSNGLIARTGSGAVASRTIQGTTNQVNVSNGNGVSGNPVLSLPQDIHTGATPTFHSLTLTTELGGLNIEGGRVNLYPNPTWGGWVRGYHFRGADNEHLAGVAAYGGAGTRVDRLSMGFGAAYDVTEAIHLLSDGNVGIGTTSPSHRLDVSGTGRISGLLTLGAQATGAGHAVRADRTLRIQGTSNRISINNDAALNLTSNRAWQITAPQDLHTDANFLVGTLRAKQWAGSQDFTSRVSGWRVNADGNADFRHIYADELTVQSFTADVAQALVGSDYLTKSRATLASSFAAPGSVNGTAILHVEDLEELGAIPVFEDGDTLRLRYVSRDGGGLIVRDVWGTVAGYGNQGDGTQTWTFTRRRSAEADQVIHKGAVALDYGKPGDSLIVRTVLDQQGSPYERMMTWWDDDEDHVPDRYEVITQIGRLTGLTFPGVAELKDGIFAAAGYLSKEVIIGGAGLSIDSFQQRPSALWHFDGSLVDTISGATPDGYEDATITDYGLVTGAGLVATLRKDGKFGGGVAVEAGTTNLLYPGGLITSNASLEVVGDHTYHITNPTNASFGRVTSQVFTLAPGESVTISMHVIDWYGTVSFNIRSSNAGSSSAYVTWGPETRNTRTIRTYTNTSDSERTFSLWLNVYGDSNPNGEQYITVSNIQIEKKPFATSFTEGTRADGSLSYPVSLGDTWSVSFWATSEDEKQQPTNDTVPRLFDIYRDGNNFIRVLRLTEGPMVVQVRHDGDQVINSPVATYEEGEHLYTLTYDGETYRLYHDGDEITALAAPSFVGSADLHLGRRADTANSIWNGTFSGVSWWDYALSASEIRRIALSDAPIQERPSQVRITGEQILVGTDTLIRDGFIQSKYIAANSLTTEQLSFTPLLSADGTGDIIATINATSEGLRIAGSKIEINGDVHFTSDLYDPSKKATPGDIDDAIDAYDDTLGDLSKQDLVEDAMRGEGLISGAYLKMDLIDTESLFAQQASIGDWDIVSGNITSAGVTLNSSGYISLADNAGISGTGSGNDAVRMWAGGTYANRASAAFNVRHDGTLNATKANITGEVNANSGHIGDWQIGTGKLTGGSIELLSSGKIWQTDNHWALNDNGSGRLANGNISWNAAGEIEIVGANGGVSISDTGIHIASDPTQTIPRKAYRLNFGAYSSITESAGSNPAFSIGSSGGTSGLPMRLVPFGELQIRVHVGGQTGEYAYSFYGGDIYRGYGYENPFFHAGNHNHRTDSENDTRYDARYPRVHELSSSATPSVGLGKVGDIAFQNGGSNIWLKKRNPDNSTTWARIDR